MDTLLKENIILQTKLDDKIRQFLQREPNSAKKKSTFAFLEVLKEIATRNNKIGYHGNRYNNTVKLFSTYLFIVGGRQLYDTLKQNLPLPSLSSISTYMYDELPTPIEGSVRTEALLEFLQNKNLPKVVWISEDATRISEKIEYDPKSNQLIGFVPALNKITGFPVLQSFPADSALTIYNYFQNKENSKYVNVIIAQALCEDCPKFCLAIYGTNNRFSAVDVIKRFDYLVSQLTQVGIKILGIL